MNTNQVLHFNPLIEKGRSFDHFQFLSASVVVETSHLPI